LYFGSIRKKSFSKENDEMRREICASLSRKTVTFWLVNLFLANSSQEIEEMTKFAAARDELKLPSNYLKTSPLINFTRPGFE